MPHKDITNQSFGRLTALRFSHYGPNGYAHWLFKCSCGKEITTSASLVWRGLKSSCGCYQKEMMAKANLKHGYKGKRVYTIWQMMKVRCLNKNHIAYNRYGGRGITCCKRWLKFESFLEDMGEPPSRLHTLDRIDNNKNYCKENCKWSTKKEQNRNARSNKLITYLGKTRCIAEWAELAGKDYFLVWDRLRNGWSIERALLEPIHTEKIRNT